MVSTHMKELNIPSNKLIVAFGNYGYDWKVNSKEPAKSLTFQKLWQWLIIQI